MIINNYQRQSGSFRDPSGFIFNHDGKLYRQVNTSYKEEYEHLINSGLFNKLVDDYLLISHEEVELGGFDERRKHKIIQPLEIPFISYPYEWCFSQLKQAALTTLKIQTIAYSYGMTLKDANAYNIQFYNGNATLIDTLSFEKYQQGQPWAAYRQFCQHFLAPLALMSYKDQRLNQLLKIYIDGIPLDLTDKLLPFKSMLNIGILIHLKMHAKSQAKYSASNNITPKPGIKKIAFEGIIDSLKSTVDKMTIQPDKNLWADYYKTNNYSAESIKHKISLVEHYLDLSKPKMVWDLGANTGLFSRVAAKKNIDTISFDIDPGCVEINYLESIKNKETCLLPLSLDLTNPSPGVGWANNERISLKERGPADLVLALALIHHIAIGNNVPINMIANYLSQLCKMLIIEFVPKSDSQVQRLLSNRKDIFPNYDEKVFEHEFSNYFNIRKSEHIKGTERRLYLMEKKGCTLPGKMI